MRVLIIKSKTYGIKECYYDDFDHDLISQYIWCIVPNRKTFYAFSRIKIGYKRYRSIRMHQLFLSGGHIDHRDGNGLNNQRSNLRIATTQQNTCNVAITKRNKSGYKGVYKTRYNSFIACVRKNGVLYHGGTFKTPVEAAKKYNEMALWHHGEFAWLNPL
jgi:hypothetical protein